MRTVRVGLVGAGFISESHAVSLKETPGASAVAVQSRSLEKAQAFALAHAIPHAFDDFGTMLDSVELDAVVLGCPNDLHCEYTVAAARAGKHILCEKPLCLSLAEADRMIAECRKAGVVFMYAEELCFAPKYVRLKSLVDEGALGRITVVKQSEKHDGPHAGWFWDVERSGGGVALDMGCHGIEFARWMLSGPSCRPRPEIRSVQAHLQTAVHGDRTAGDDNAILILEFAGGQVALIEESWTKPGGMDDKAEVYGTDGVAYADLLRGSSMPVYSRRGYGYAVEKAGSTKGWSFAMADEAWNYGFPQEMDHFIDCIREQKEPLVTHEDGRAVLEAIHAAYASASSGKKIALPFVTEAARPIDHWR